MNSSPQTTETLATASAKLAPPAGISLATVMGVQVSELVLWATLIYTLLLIGHKVYQIWKDITAKPSVEE
jgi:hypothetical protein